jgi:hypothetical protein
MVTLKNLSKRNDGHQRGQVEAQSGKDSHSRAPHVKNRHVLATLERQALKEQCMRILSNENTHPKPRLRPLADVATAIEQIGHYMRTMLVE